MVKKIWVTILVCCVVWLLYWIIFVPKLYYIPDFRANKHYQILFDAPMQRSLIEKIQTTLWIGMYTQSPSDLVYSYDIWNVYYAGKKLQGARAWSFVPMWMFGIDYYSKNVYARSMMLSWYDFDSVSFIWYNYFYFYDKNCLYFPLFWGTSDEFKKVECISYSWSLLSLRPGYNTYVKDDQHVFFMGSIISWADPDDAVITWWRFLISSWKIFDQWVLLTGAKASSFVATGVRLRMTGDDGTWYYTNKQAWYDGDQYYY
jgi:hypothetical protein